MFLKLINTRLYDYWDERHLVLVTWRPLAERAYLVNNQMSPEARNYYTEVSPEIQCHHLVIEKKEIYVPEYFNRNTNNYKRS